MSPFCWFSVLFELGSIILGCCRMRKLFGLELDRKAIEGCRISVESTDFRQTLYFRSVSLVDFRRHHIIIIFVDNELLALYQPRESQ